MLKLIEELQKIKLIEAGDIIVPNAGALAHKSEYRIGIWWYNLQNGDLLSSTKYSHADVKGFPELANMDVKDWCRGRIIKYGGNNYIVVYSYDFLENGSMLTGNILADIVQKVSNKLGVAIEGAVNEQGQALVKW
jgi:hypothetical protein